MGKDANYDCTVFVIVNVIETCIYVTKSVGKDANYDCTILQQLLNSLFNIETVIRTTSTLKDTGFGGFLFVLVLFITN